MGMPLDHGCMPADRMGIASTLHVVANALKQGPRHA